MNRKNLYHLSPSRDGRSHQGRTPGFTLVELLVVIAIIGVLVALLLPAVQSAREAARRNTCVNNIKQLALACQVYHDARGHMPLSYGYVSNSGMGWIVSVLPQLEEQPLYDQYQKLLKGTKQGGPGGIDSSPTGPSRGGSATTEDPVGDIRTAQLAVMHCPSDPLNMDEDIMKKNWQFVGLRCALTNYKGTIGDHNVGGGGGVHIGSPDMHGSTDTNGLFSRESWRKPKRFKDCTDGLSRTRMIGEDVPRWNYHSAGFYANGDWASCNAINYKPEPPDPDNWPIAINFRSMHPGGVHFARADASAEFVSDSIDHGQYRASCTMDGGEIRTTDETNPPPPPRNPGR